MSTWVTAFRVFLCFRVTVDGYLQSILTGVVVRLARQKLVAWHFYGHLLFEVGWPLEMYICMAFSSMDEEVGFHISCFEWTLGECGQPKKLIPEGQGILAFAYLSIKNKMVAGSDFDCRGPLIFARQKQVCYCRMFGHVFEVREIITWVTASCTLVWFFSSVNAKVRFKISCLGKWPTTLFTAMWPLSTVGEQMSAEIWFCDWGVLAPFAFIWLL